MNKELNVLKKEKNKIKDLKNKDNKRQLSIEKLNKNELEYKNRSEKNR